VPDIQPVYSSLTPSSTPIKVLVVDDSAFMRHMICQALNQQPDISVVGAARDGYEALEMIARLQPDVVTLDVEMPRLDGLSTLRRIMSDFPRPVVMLSSLTQEGAVETIQALTLGAVDFVGKPANQVNIQQVMDETITKIKKAASARVRANLGGLKLPHEITKHQLEKDKDTRPLVNEPIVLIGTSTGGPRALNELIPALPANLPAAVVVVQHMPAGFTRSLADRLNGSSQLRVKEAEVGDRLEIGRVLVAPGGFHMVLDENLRIALNQNPPVHGVRPAVDVTLLSLVQRYGKGVIAAILTGMGSDGTNGATLLHGLGGHVIAEDESTCVVWGMPRSVYEAGAASEVLPLSEIAVAIERAVRAQSNR
jgi:two-component system, chemotaxis family, protein-glutamate methylesterase/glutaminase